MSHAEGEPSLGQSVFLHLGAHHHESHSSLPSQPHQDPHEARAGGRADGPETQGPAIAQHAAQSNRFSLSCLLWPARSEIAQLQVADVRIESARPHLRIRTGASKGGRPRTVPLWWDAGTLADLAAWKATRREQGAQPRDVFVASIRLHRQGESLSRYTLRKRFRTACKVLGAERLELLTIHHGRHTFISHALAGGRTLAEVRDAAGHANISITSGYLHVAVDDDGIGELFAYA